MVGHTKPTANGGVTAVVTAKGAPVGIGTGAVTGAGITVGIVADIAAGIVAAVIADMGTVTTPKGAGTHVTTHVTVIGSAAVFRGSITW